MIEKDHLYDKRIVNRNIVRGRITKKDLAEYLASLPELEKQADTVVVEVRQGEFEMPFPELEEEE